MSTAASTSSRGSVTRMACGNCRKRKIRCDAQRPVCTACRNRGSAASDDPCEYVDESGRTPAEMLEASISRLERRIRELESVDNPSAVRLQSPYLQSFVPSTSQGQHWSGTRSISSQPMPSVLDRNSVLESHLSRVLLQVSAMLSSSHPQALINTIQAEILLANYFFHTNRILEGRYRLDTAVSLATSGKLYQVRNANALAPPVSTDAENPVQEGERINAFWVVYSMHNLWNPPEHGPPVFNRDGQRVDTPWPLDMLDYEQTGIPVGLTGYSTVNNFVTGATGSSGQGNSLMAMYSKASILLSRATLLRHRASRAPVTSDSIASFNNLGQLIDSFASELPPVPTTTSASTVQNVVLIHTLAYTSIIRLHSAFADTDARSSTKSLATAQAAIALLPTVDALRQDDDVVQFPILNPIFAVLWDIVGEVLVKEIKRLRRLRPTVVRDQISEIEGMLEGLMTTMQELSGHSPLIGA
ncbi:hypothetical protein AAF712_008021 [Marasmius tenuissimus]|uniref:Zn(2)-C6 fungal-type domain-containing protein n=1 Tax=Marasmius tenuissimus TaxID=585030 RepID=A0ABR2ZW62_9AGAR